MFGLFFFFFTFFEGRWIQSLQKLTRSQNKWKVEELCRKTLVFVVAFFFDVFGRRTLGALMDGERLACGSGWTKWGSSMGASNRL